jgi:hypothetical protein
LNIKFVFWFSQHLSETFLTLRRIQQDGINIPRSSCIVPIMLPEFNDTSTFSTNFRKTLKHQVPRKYSNIKFHENAQTSNFTKILKHQISRKYSNIKFHENTQTSNFTKILKHQISWKYMKILKLQILRKYSNIEFHENTQTSNFMKILKHQISRKSAQ